MLNQIYWIQVFAAFLTTVSFIGVLRRYAVNWQLVDRPDARKQHDGTVPTIGGLAMGCAFILGVFLLPYGSEQLALLVALSLIMVTGVIDDRFALPTSIRFLSQILATAIMIQWGGVYLSELGDLLGTGPVELGAWAVPFTIFCVVGVINAINMADGLDGLAGGICMIAVAWLLLFAALANRPAMELSLLLLLVGVLAGFLCFNLRHPWRGRAAVFMGDCGSMSLGFVVCWFLVSLSQGEQAALSPMLAVWILGLPLMDTVAIMVRRAFNGQSPVAADRRHLHHLLLKLGFSHQQTVAWLLLVAALFGVVGVGIQWLGGSESVLFYTFWTLFFGYYYLLARTWRKYAARPASIPLRVGAS